MTTITNAHIPKLIQWVQQQNKPFTIFDIETTGLSREYDRLVEIGMICIQPSGRIQHSGCYINPERSIPAVASSVHGIYQKDVADQENFLRIAPFFQKAFQEHIIGGFNTRQFDVAMMIGNAKAYGLTFPHPQLQLDLRDMWREIEKKSAGKLSDVADKYGVEKGTAHRALGDVETTVRLYEAMLTEHGPELFNNILYPSQEVLAAKEVARQQKNNKTSIKRIIIDSIHTAIVEYGRFTDVEMQKLSETLNVTAANISFAISDYFTEYPDHIDFFADEKAQHFLKHKLPQYLVTTEDRKLRPIKEWLIEKHGQDIDYVQIRLALLYFNQLTPQPSL